MKPPINSGNSAVCSIATAVRAHQQAGDFDQAAALLFAHIEQLIERDGWPLARDLLARFPTARFDSEPALLYMQGLTCAHADELARAESFLKRAHTFFKQRCAFAEAVRCSLELARVYQRREDFRTAHLLLEETERLLQQVEREQLSAHFFYRLAELYPDIGRLQEGDVQAQQALAHYELQGDLAGQFKTLRLRSIIARQQGRYQEASSYLELAKGLLRTGNFTPAQEALVLNSEAHLLWYSNRLPEALAVAQRLQRHAEQHQITKQQVYAQTLLSNLYRARGDHAAAAQAYQALRSLVVELTFERFLPWVDAHEGWLCVLRGEPERGRRLLHRALETPDDGQRVSFHVCLGVLNLLDECYGVADDLLQNSLAFYEQSGDALSAHNINLYRALLAFRQGQVEHAIERLVPVLGWMAERQLVYLPHWWHPPLVAELCVYARAHDLAPHTVERLFAEGVGELARPVAQRFTEHEQTGHESTALRRAAGELLAALATRTTFTLAHVADARVRRVLEELFNAGQLRRDGFLRLQERLITAQQRRTVNATAVAVFGLYLHGVPRDEIAERLGLSLASVRNYITLFYQVFDLPKEQFSSTRARRRALWAVAEGEGFV